MALTFFWRCEGTTLDGTHDYSGGDTSATAQNGSISLTTNANRVGTYGIETTAAVLTAYQFDPTDNGIFTNYTTPSSAVGSAAFSVQAPTALPQTTNVCGWMVRSATSTTDAFRVTYDDTHGFRFWIGNDSYGDVYVRTNSISLSTATWYGIVIRWDIPSDTMKIELYNAAGSLLSSGTQQYDNSDTPSSYDLSLYVPGGSMSNTSGIRLGSVTGANTGNMYFDNFFFADAYDEPLENNLTITSYTNYSAGDVTITDAGDENYVNGETGITITGTNFEASQGTGAVYISPTDDIDDASKVTQTVTAWGDTSITFTAVRGSLATSTTYYLFVKNNTGNSNTAGHAVQFSLAPIQLKWTS